MPKIHIFKSGVHTAMNGASMNYTDAILQEMANSYNPETHKAPLVLGHPATDDPAMGWVSGVEFRDGGLYATTDNVMPDFAQAVKDKLYNKVSASFYTPPPVNGT